VIIASFAEMTAVEAKAHRPKVIRVDGRNRFVGLEPEVPGPAMPRRLSA